MSTYTDASLIYYPSGYKASKAYSLKPTDGSGDLTFTRASTATRVNEQGLIEGVRTNLALYSEEFDNAAWTTNSGASVTANTIISPNGTLNADTLEGNGTQTYIRVAESITVPTAGTYVLSIFAKAGTNNFLNINFEGYTGGVGTFLAYFDLINGTTPTSGASIEDYGNGWYRCISAPYTIVASDLNGNIVALATPSTSSVLFSTAADTNGKSLYLYGAMLEQSASATEYIPTTTAAVSVGMLANVPRIDYTGGGCGKLLLEPQRTNYITYSNYDASTWTQTTASISINSATSPDGTTNAHTATRTSGSNQRIGIAAFSATVGQPYTNSIYLRKVSGSGLVRLIDINNTATTFTLTTEWVRYSVTAIAIASTQRLYVEMTEDGDVIEFWQGQIENGSYPTSLIPTTTTAVTRVADSASKSGISSLINSEEGVLYLEAKVQADTIFAANSIAISDGTDANRLSIIMYGNLETIRSNMNVGSVSQFDFNLSGYSQEQYYKIAVSYKVNDCKIFINGTKISTDTSATMPSIGTFDRLNLNLGTGLYPFYGNVKNLIVFPSALSDTELATLTTI